MTKRANELQRALLFSSVLPISMLCLENRTDAAPPGLFWSDAGEGRIYAADLDGSSSHVILDSGVGNPWGIAIDELLGKIYWGEINLAQIRRASFTGFDVEIVLAAPFVLDDPAGLALNANGSELYWTDFSLGKIFRTNLISGDTSILIASGVIPTQRPLGIDLDVRNDAFYWTDFLTNTIRRRVPGMLPEVILDSLDNPRDVSLDLVNDKLYWIESTNGVFRANLNGTEAEFVIPHGGQSLAVDGVSENLYWTSGLPSIGRANLDGTSIEREFIQLEFCCPFGIAIVADCNHNQSGDKADVLLGSSPDTNGNLVPDECEFDTDGDGVIDLYDMCPLDNPDDTDGDGICDSLDICPGFDDEVDSDEDSVPDGCDICRGHDDGADGDGDGVPDGCDFCPGTNDGAPDALGDSDQDGFANCVDQCPGVNDELFAPQCEQAIPAVSSWGLVILVLVVLCIAKATLGHRLVQPV